EEEERYVNTMGEELSVAMDGSQDPRLEALLLRMMGKVNKERLGEFLGELQRKEDTNDRYVAALKGETLTRNPYIRIQPTTPPQVDN
ncbi:hypothetical protein Tco_1511590, partial [Tanacetum coccineum]